MYWSSRPNGILGQNERDHTTWFQVCIVDGGKVEIIDYKGEYLSADPQNPGAPVTIVKDRKSPDCDFGLEYKNQKVALKASNGKYVSRIYHIPTETHSIEAQKESADVFSLFDRVGADA
ncbi:hypothetical protein NDU88_001231 [Pleurodeles waltl]|uniref:Fascin-like domain-containing protein n=1 Tax=Pleurodeles waltl TaxID=8319 RepID=A0AAV7Q5E2_PLEWA|nr:hypothetical protein NDU88_001231 [Pleurodeles waltl]